MAKSLKRVEQAAADLGLDITIQLMPDSTGTARDAAAACSCDVGKIVKSLVFEGAVSGELKLLLVSGKREVNLDDAQIVFGEALTRADPKRVRAETGFAIGGVAPIGHLSRLATWMDRKLLQYPTVWAAAGRPNAVFEVCPNVLAEVQARVFSDAVVPRR